jgi:hypothetical protein
VARNRVTPFGTIEDLEGRGALMGNRGCIHTGREITRRWATKAWISCALEYRGRRAPMWEPNRWTPLFFLDEPTAMAAGHRPCGLCRRDDHRRFRALLGDGPLAELDATLHAERTGTRRTLELDDLPDGAMVAADDRALLVDGDVLRPWSMSGYLPAVRRGSGRVTVLTPATMITALERGYLR